MKRKVRQTRRHHKRKAGSKSKHNARRASRHRRRSNKKSRSRQNKSVIYHNGRRLKVHTLKGGNKFSNVPMSYGYSLGGVELAPENLNLANRPPHQSYKKCF